MATTIVHTEVQDQWLTKIQAARKAFNSVLVWLDDQISLGGMCEVEQVREEACTAKDALRESSTNRRPEASMPQRSFTAHGSASKRNAGANPSKDTRWVFSILMETIKNYEKHMFFSMKTMKTQKNLFVCLKNIFTELRALHNDACGIFGLEKDIRLKGTVFDRILGPKNGPEDFAVEPSFLCRVCRALYLAIKQGSIQILAIYIGEF